ncbi:MULTISPECIES: AI-2E family transporter [unclassified Polynucleobacter]|uniref:AI-2E family transporter n=1 Tax=unclassified Polynucleobacter TaxID=2640945 RepID=UPI001BFCE55A|nr:MULTISPECIES: AI-2E family transporter [unclassified Polynucleobacter]MBU3548319.1 AI-2E family transporter [Polynucleobacter sp. P1-05-14]MBU3639694.1 AI-2E family transporter [Polynucleobacter sp. AP-RePozz3-80-G7]QWD81304.1 AI-2E family transporter [Polynucleobacter sp. MWH-S4W17]
MAEIFTPFLAAFILAYILRPAFLWLERRRLAASLAAALTVVLGLTVVIAIVSLFIGLLKTEIPLIKAQLPTWIANTQAWLGPKLADFHIDVDWGSLKSTASQKISEHISDNADSLMSTTIDTVLMSGSSVITGFVNSVLILFVMFYLLIDWNQFFQYVKNLVPKRAQETVHHLAMHTDGLLSQYLNGMVIVVSIMSAFYSISLSLIGIRGAVALGVFTALMIVIPYIGIALGFTLAIVSALLQFGPGSEIIGVLVIYGIGQFLEGFFLTPRLVGERIGLHPVAVLFALLFFGKLFGFFGVLLALPISAVSLVLVQYLWSIYTQSSWYQK